MRSPYRQAELHAIDYTCMVAFSEEADAHQLVEMPSNCACTQARMHTHPHQYTYNMMHTTYHIQRGPYDVLRTFALLEMA